MAIWTLQRVLLRRLYKEAYLEGAKDSYTIGMYGLTEKTEKDDSNVIRKADEWITKNLENR